MDRKKSEDSKLVIKQGEDPFIYSYRTLAQMKAREDYNFYAIIIVLHFQKKMKAISLYQDKKNLFRNIMLFLNSWTKE